MRILFLLLAVLLVTLTGCQPYQYHGLLLDSPAQAANFTLTSQSGEPVSLSELRGKPVLLYFGYTFCPDVCPTTLSTLNKALEIMGKKADDVQVVMVSVDPERDTPEVLATYLSNFNPSFIGLTGTHDQIASAATGLGVFFEKHEGSAATGYLVDHTASVMVLDREGRLRLVLPFETPAEDIASDLTQLLK
ncbi:MAG TPA: SCO family protein [Anaerolineae bacterium]|nr:SCO family protein [Anaerolineae bacterium]